ncbi:MAG: SufB/SufD family protein [Candidatus Nanosyncoccaceae bacterium]|jgi:Fe-S cluster assembly scaffold protein SufB
MSKADNLLNQLGFTKRKPTTQNQRVNGENTARITSKYTVVVDKTGGDGLEIHVAENAPFEVIDLPVLITKSGLQEEVKNDIFIGTGANVIILAGCGICADGCDVTMHRGEHNFLVGAGAKLRYIERHIGTGDSTEKIIHPTSNIKLEHDAEMEIITSQLGGVDKSKRVQEIALAHDSKLVITERIFTDKAQVTHSSYFANIRGNNASLKISSRSVATENSIQKFVSNIIGSTTCFAHVECDAIIKDRARVNAIPQVFAKHPDAQLIHEASIGKIAGEQLDKLMSLGLSTKEAERIIINGFLK